MFKAFKEKLIITTDRVISFFKDNLAQVIFLIFLLQFLLYAKSFPYLNIIGNYEFYVIALILFLSMVIFRVIIPYDRVVKGVLIVFGLAFVFSLLEQETVNNMFGFIAFVLLALIVGRQVLRERKDLKRLEN